MNIKKILLFTMLLVLLLGIVNAGEIPDDNQDISTSSIDTSTTMDNSISKQISIEKTDSVKNVKTMDADENDPKYKEFTRFYNTITENTNSSVSFDFKSDVTLYESTIVNEKIKKLSINGNNKNINGNNYHQFLIIEHNCSVTINNLKVSHCYSDQDGGCISNYGILTISNSTLNNNRAERFGGAINNHGTITLNNMTVNNNHAGSDGGAINNEGKATIKNSIINNNYSPEWGGAIFDEDLQLIITNTTINRNSAKYGGAIHTYKGNLQITNCNLNNNHANQSGGAIHSDNSKSKISITNSNINGNNATMGGAIYTLGNMTVKTSKLNNNNGQYGGALLINGSDNTIVNNIFSDNNALIGGAILNAENNTTIKNNTFTKNTVSTMEIMDDFWQPIIGGIGGAIANGGTIYEIHTSSYNTYTIPKFMLTSNTHIIENQFNNNTANEGAAIYNYGGVNTTITKNIFNYNNANSEGTSIYDKIHEYTIQEYTANGSPAGTVTKQIGSNLNIAYNTFTKNKANTTGKTIKANLANIQGNDINAENTEYPSTIYTNTENVKITNNIFDSTPKITINKIASKQYKDNITITGKFTDKTGKALGNSQIKIKINTKTVTVKTDPKGVYKYNTKASTIGKNNVTITFTGNTKYAASTNKTTFTVTKATTKATITKITQKTYKQNMTITGKLTDSTGTIIKNINVKVKVNTKTYTVKTNSKGIYTLKVTANKVGTNNVTVTFARNKYYKAVTKKTTFKTVARATKLTVNKISTTTKGKTVKITGKLSDNLKSPVMNSLVKIKINKKTVTVKTNKQGVYTYNYKTTTKGTNNITVTFAGSTNYKKTSVKSSFSVK